MILIRQKCRCIDTFLTCPVESVANITVHRYSGTVHSVVRELMHTIVLIEREREREREIVCLGVVSIFSIMRGGGGGVLAG
jgi:hypothetical protein